MKYKPVEHLSDFVAYLNFHAIVIVFLVYMYVFERTYGIGSNKSKTQIMNPVNRFRVMMNFFLEP